MNQITAEAAAELVSNTLNATERFKATDPNWRYLGLAEAYRSVYLYNEFISNLLFYDHFVCIHGPYPDGPFSQVSQDIGRVYYHEPDMPELVIRFFHKRLRIPW